MGAYIYCRNCEAPMPAPEAMDTEEILKGAIYGDHEVLCVRCNEPVPYQQESFITALAEISDSVRHPD